MNAETALSFKNPAKHRTEKCLSPQAIDCNLIADDLRNPREVLEKPLQNALQLCERTPTVKFSKASCRKRYNTLNPNLNPKPDKP